jgi:cytoskeletal protein RodZ
MDEKRQQLLRNAGFSFPHLPDDAFQAQFNAEKAAFDQRFEEVHQDIRAGQKLVKKSMWVVLGVWLVSAVVALGLLGAAVYVAAHFLAKVW